MSNCQRFDIVQASQAMGAANTEVEFVIPKDAEEILFRLSNTTSAWRWSITKGIVAGGGGFPMSAGDDLGFAGPLARTVLYFAAAKAGTTLHYTWLQPHRERP